MTLRILRTSTRPAPDVCAGAACALDDVPEPVRASIRRVFGDDLTPSQAVARILDDVAERGDAALHEWTARIDGVDAGQAGGAARASGRPPIARCQRTCLLRAGPGCRPHPRLPRAPAADLVDHRATWAGRWGSAWRPCSAWASTCPAARRRCPRRC